MIRRNISNAPQVIKEQAYKTFIRQSAEYAHTVWDPYQQNHINQIERIQRKAVRYVTSNYERQASVTEMRERLGWPTLQQRHCVARLTMFHKIENNNIAIYVPDYISKSTRSLRSQHQQAYIIPQNNVETYQFSFFQCTVRCWKQLPIYLTEVPSQETF